jgi:GntR family transcriptional regulator/MocR family aminotransferase
VTNKAVAGNIHLKRDLYDHYLRAMSAAPPGILPVIAVDRNASKPLYRQLYEGYRDAIVERRLRPGQRLPSTRSLAIELEISRIPVLNAFEQLLAEGYFESRTGSGTFVASALPGENLAPARRAAVRAAPAKPAPRKIGRMAAELRRLETGPWFRGRGAFSVGEPALDRFPLSVWSSLVARHARRADPALLPYGDSMGLAALREAVAEYLRTARAVRCEPDQIMIVNGSQQALELAARVLLDVESPVWIEEPGYFGLHRVLSLAGARLVPVPVDAHGLDVAAAIARSPKPRAVFVTPSHQFPLGVTMSASRRLQLLDFARESGCWIVEDDYDSEYRYGNLPIAALQGLDRDARVIYIGTFTKILFPAIRLAYLVLPPDLVYAFTQVRYAMDILSPTFSQAVLADFVREGHFARHIRRMRVLCRERREALVGALARELPDEMHVLGDAAGMYLTATLPRGRRDLEISLRAAERNLWAAPLSDAYVGRPARQGLILGYGSTPAERIQEGVVRLREVMTGLRTKD